MCVCGGGIGKQPMGRIAPIFLKFLFLFFSSSSSCELGPPARSGVDRDRRHTGTIPLLPGRGEIPKESSGPQVTRAKRYGEKNLGGFGLRWLRANMGTQERTRTAEDPMYVLYIYKGFFHSR